MADAQSTAKRLYEIMYIVGGDKTDDAVRTIQREVKEEITSRDGSITKEDVWGLREMTYPIKRQSTGYYHVYNFELPGTKLNDMIKHMRLNTNVLRFLITTVPENYQFIPYTALMERGKKPAKRGGREADVIRAEGTAFKTDRRTMTTAPAPRKDAETAAPRATTAAPRTTRHEAPAAAPAAPAMKEHTKTPPVAAVPEKAPVSEEERLKKLDEELSKLINTDEI